MDRVAERPVSSSSATNRSSTNSSNSSNSCHSRDLGKPPRRSCYRLFPSVEPTPPASPVFLYHHQRTSLRNSANGGHSRRRSSSEDNNGRSANDNKDAQLPSSHAPASLWPSPTKDVKKGSVSELSHLRTVQENGCPDMDVASKFPSGMKPVLLGGSQQVRAQQDVFIDNLFDSALPEAPPDGACDKYATMAFHRGYDRSKPPRDCADEPDTGLGLDIPTVLIPDDDWSLSQSYINSRTKPRPNLRIAIVKRSSDASPTAQSQSLLQHSRQGSTASSSDGSVRSLLQERSAVRGARAASVALEQSIVSLSGELKVRELTVAPHAGRLRMSQQVAEPVHASEAKGRSQRPSSPSVSPRRNVGRWAELPSLASRFNNRAATPELIRFPTSDHHAAHTGRPVTSLSHPISNVASVSPNDHAESPQAATPELTGRSALAAARAKVAALNQIEVPAWNSRFSEQIKTPMSDLGSLHSQSTYAGITDPVQTLTEIGEQVEALHIRYATLRTQRQQLSSGIIANLKDQKPGPEYSETLLNQQLSLAAVSSSIDICFAKLKSLECLREDAIATLVAQATTIRRAPDEAAMGSRKGSLAPSVDSGCRLATGRSTPDLHAIYRLNQPGPIKVHTHPSDLDRQWTRSPMYSTRLPLATEPSTITDQHNDTQTSCRSQRLGQIHEPSETAAFSCGTAVASSYAEEVDDSATPDLTDIDLDNTPSDGLLRKLQRTDVNRSGLESFGALDDRLDNVPVSPINISANSTQKMSGALPKLEMRPDNDGKAGTDDVSPLTSSTLNPDDTDQLARDLEVQLQSFPSAPARPTSEVHGIERRHDSPVQRSNTGKSIASAYTINVYFDDPREELPPLP